MRPVRPYYESHAAPSPFEFETPGLVQTNTVFLKNLQKVMKFKNYEIWLYLISVFYFSLIFFNGILDKPSSPWYFGA